MDLQAPKKTKCQALPYFPGFPTDDHSHEELSMDIYYIYGMIIPGYEWIIYRYPWNYMDPWHKYLWISVNNLEISISNSTISTNTPQISMDACGYCGYPGSMGKYGKKKLGSVPPFSP